MPIGSDALQVHQLPAVVQRHQQHVTPLAQVVRTAALGGQVGVARIGAASVAPQAGGIVGGLLLALVVAIVKLVVGVLIIALFENSMARLRFCATSRVTWAGFGFAFLAFVSLLVA